MLYAFVCLLLLLITLPLINYLAWIDGILYLWLKMGSDGFISYKHHHSYIMWGPFFIFIL